MVICLSLKGEQKIFEIGGSDLEDNRGSYPQSLWEACSMRDTR